jgi:hypothetical protein
VRLLGAELLKLRRRLATYVVLGLLLGIMGLIYLVLGLTGRGEMGPAGLALLTFPDAYAILAQFVIGLGSLLAVAYAAAVAGAEWNWGVLRNVISRGESRALYIVIKGVALAIIFAIGVLIAYAAGILMIFAAAALAGISAGNPFSAAGLRQLTDSLVLGYPVLIERAAIGFAVAVLLKSQLAGVVVGIALYIGESILAGIMLVISFAGRFTPGEGMDLSPVGPDWYQYLPFSIGDSVLTAVVPSSATGGLEEMIQRPVPLEQAFVGVLIYLAVAIVVSVVAVQRQEINA